jgi:pyruvate formate lyase activating enzyme
MQIIPIMMQEAMFYVPRGKRLVCGLCPHSCAIDQGARGICGVRQNIGGKLYTLVYGKAIASHIDPIEKKPLFHFFPGSRVFSFATAGCNFRCDFCQNWEISQISKGKRAEVIGDLLSPKDIVKAAVLSGCRSVAMTYNEPTIFFEYAYDTCVLAKKHGLGTVFVSNGYISNDPISKISEVLDAVNIDIKSFSDAFYKKNCGGRLQPVLDAVKQYHEKGVWVEATTLIIPGENDSKDELREIARFIESVDSEIPWHLSRFHADYKRTDAQETPVKTLEEAYAIGKEAGLKHVYLGNVIGLHEDTICNACGKAVIRRSGFQILDNQLQDGKCPCGASIPGRF